MPSYRLGFRHSLTYRHINIISIDIVTGLEEKKKINLEKKIFEFYIKIYTAYDQNVINI